jgi:hypothetical protein
VSLLIQSNQISHAITAVPHGIPNTMIDADHYTLYILR